MRTVAVTGADGFVGTHLCAALEAEGCRVIRITRRAAKQTNGSIRVANLSDLNEVTQAFEGADVAVHLAGRAHVLQEVEPDPAAAFHEVNVGGTDRVCLAAHRVGIRRIVFVSSIGVNGDRTESRAFVEEDAPNPVEPYARSKLRAEEILHLRSRELAFESVIVRPSLIYGRGVKGNFLRLLRLAYSGIPLPLAGIQNRRNLIGVSNLCQLLCLCVHHRSAVGQIYLAADPWAYSTADLLRSLYAAFGKPDRLFYVPEPMLRFATRVLGLHGQFEKLCASLEVRADKAHRQLGWQPTIAFEEEIARTAKWYLEHRGRNE